MRGTESTVLFTWSHAVVFAPNSPVFVRRVPLCEMLSMMKQVVIHAFGGADELMLTETPSPKVQPGEVLIQNEVAAVNPYDWMARKGEMKFLTGRKFPMVLGAEAAGVVTEVGSAVQGLHQGARVIAICGRAGGYAQQIAIAASQVVALPDNVDFDEGACLPVAGSTAWDALHQIAKIERGQRVLIYGAAGGVGTCAVQLAKQAGCEVTAAARSDKHELLRSLGADHVFDYTRQSLAQTPGVFDLIFDTPSVLGYLQTKKKLSDGGVYIATLPTPAAFLWWGLTLLTGRKCRVVLAAPTVKKVATLASLVSQRQLRVVIDRSYPIAQVAEAHRYSETKRAAGKIVLKF